VPENAHIQFPLSYVLFTRFGAGMGHFRTHSDLFDPDGESIATTDEQMFWLSKRDASHTFVGHITMPVEKNGPYRWVCYLDGEQVGEYVFTVNIEKTFLSAG
jgi:hypothetical protein